ncbi:hypothetical protein [Vibrio agarivorans]|uniref:Uncharacterized protein n=1 Tax=Vibrio agarivorans TaxID=153622 RepID=A0ABT7Y5Y7_9VIBR|nr:hypothetical protein [Vibrio agarivorans]MDN2483423.1 hypothetical protein [Vibrio agarivorans]MDN3660326.1 hypothetical protein [Vibrio agarivorans]
MEEKKINQEVTVVDIKMPFLSMVVFLVKLAIAAIPAMIILSIIFTILGAIFGGVFHSFFYSHGY